MKQAILLLALIAVPLSAAGNCYQILDRGGETIYLERSPPWSLEWPPTDTSARDASRARGEQFIIHRGRPCTDFSASTSSSDPMREAVRQSNVDAERPMRTQPAAPAQRAQPPRAQPATPARSAARPAAAGGRNPACQVSEAQARSDLAANLAERYPSSYSTQRMLLNSGMERFRALCAIPSDPVSDGVLRDLNRRYYPSFSTIHMLYESNMEAHRDLQR